MVLDLSEQHLQLLRRILRQYVPEMAVWAFGSRINGNAHAGSDLDIVIIDPTFPERAQTQLINLRRALHDSSLPMLVDTLDWAKLPDDFRQQIEQCHYVIVK